MIQCCHFKLKSVFVLILCAVLFGSASAKSSHKELSTKTLRSMARAYMAFGKYEKAHVLAERALAQAKQKKTEDGEMALCLIDLGTVYGYEGLLSQAAEKFEAGVELQKKALFETHPYVAHTLRMLSDIYRRQDNLQQAEEVLSEAVTIMLDNCDLHSKEMAPFILESAKLQFAKGHSEQALTNYRIALDIYEQDYGSQHLMTANVLEDMALVYMDQKDTDQAGQLMSASLAIKSKIFGRYHSELIDSWLTMARICKYQGQPERCEYYLAKSTETASGSRNVITMARVYEQANQIRKEGIVALAMNGG
ncbi:MAG: tetratricopeptide repeat protein [Phycisphaerae bacterium]|nr:tetratricopeptide repeat protein [Phycisphaerae bacterium]